MIIGVISVITIVLGTVFVSNVMFDLEADRHIQQVDQSILDKISGEPGLETQISHLHICQKLLLYGNILSTEDYSHYNYGKDTEPYSEKQMEATENFIKLHQFNSKVFDELDCRETSSEWETDKFHEFNHHILESNFDGNYNPSFEDSKSKAEDVDKFESIIIDPKVHSKCGTGYKLVGDRCVPVYP